MSRIWYVFFIILIAFVAIFLIFLMFSDHEQNHLVASDLQQAVMRDLQDSRDDSARMEKGVYAVNESKFRSNFDSKKIQIKDLNAPKKKYYFVIRFLQDNDKTDKQDYANEYSHQDNVLSTPIRGVQVIAIPENKMTAQVKNYMDNYVNNGKKVQSPYELLNKLNISTDSRKYVSSVIIQEFDEDTNNANSNDASKIVNHSQDNNYIYNSNISHPENSNTNADDLTDND